MMSPLPKLTDVFPPAVLRELDIALAEIGEIQPWWDEDFNCWVYEHPYYPVESEGDTSEECTERYKGWLAQFIWERMKGNIHPIDELKTKGRGGYRPGSGRPKGSLKEPKKAIRLPVDIVDWFRADPEHLQQLRRLIQG